MKAKVAGLVLGMGMALGAQAAIYHFTPIIDPTPSNPTDLGLLIDLGDQLAMEVSQGNNNNALFTFTNPGSIWSNIARIYFDDNPSGLFSNVTIKTESSGVDFSPGTHVPNPPNLPGGNIPTFSFQATDSFNANNPHAIMGINNESAATPGEFITLSGSLNAGKAFGDVLASLDAGNETMAQYLRVGLQVINIDDYRHDGDNDLKMSYLDKGTSGGESPPPPIPEPETYAMLLAGLGIMSAIARRRRTANA